MTEIFKEDDTLKAYQKKLTNILDSQFAAVKNYIKRFKHIHNFYCEDMNFDENEIRSNGRIDLFREWCERYRVEEEEINGLVNPQPIGIFHVRFDRFKKNALPAPNNKQKVLAEVLPK